MLFDENEHTLEKACESGNLSVVKCLLKDDCLKVSYVYPSSYVIYRTIEYGHLHIVKYFVEEKGMLSDGDKSLLFDFAAANGNISIVQYLYDMLIQTMPSDVGGAYVQWAYAEAVKFNRLDVVQYLVENAHANVWDNIILQWAVQKHYDSIVHYIIQQRQQ
jgi:hypothetical protein